MADSFFQTTIAFHWYAILLAFLLLALSGWLSWRELRIVRALNPSDFTRRFPGKEPWSEEGLKHRIEALTKYRRSKAWIAFGHLLVMMIFGFVVPSALLLIATLKAEWLFDHQDTFVSADSHKPVLQPSLSDASIFVASQFTKSLSDILEIFQIHMSPILIAEGAIWAQMGLLIYHLFIGTFALAAVYVIYVLVKTGFGTDAKIYRLQQRLTEMHPFSNGS